MGTLIVEDDFASRKLLQTILAPYGHCDTAANGKEAVDAFRLAWDEDRPYDLICLDIMMPEMDGQEVLREVRNYEDQRGVPDSDRAKVIMTTAAGDRQNVVEAATAGIEAYLVKPIDRQRLLDEVGRLGLLGEKPHEDTHC